MNVKTISTYLQTALAEEYAAKCIELHRVGNRGGATLLLSMPVKDPAELAGSEEKLADVVSQIARVAQEDTDGWSSPCRYYVQARFANPDAPQTRSPVVRVTPQNDIGDDDGAGENPATASGHLAQAYRHNEALGRQMALLVQSMHANLIESNKQYAEDNQRMRQERLDDLKAVEELASHAHERELELAKEARREKHFDAILTDGRKLLPAVVSKLTRLPVDSKNHPGILALARILKGLTPEQIARTAEALGGTTFAALAEAIGSFDIEAMEAAAEGEGESEDEQQDNGNNPFTN